MKNQARMIFLLTLLAGVLAALIWWLLVTRTALVLFFFKWPNARISPPQSNVDMLNSTMLDIVLFGGLALLLPVVAVIVGHCVQRQQTERLERLGFAGLVLAYCFAILTFLLLLCTLCGTWSSTFFYFY